MVFVLTEEVIPEAQWGGNSDFATFTAILGFVIVMILDVTLRSHETANILDQIGK